MSVNVSAVTNHFPTANKGFITTTSGTITSGVAQTTVPLTSVSGLTNATIFVGILSPGTASEREFTGTVDTAGSQITGVKWTDGLDSTHTAGTTIVDYVAATGQNMQTKGMLVEHNQDGTHSDITAATIVVADGGTLDVDTINEATAANGVAIDGMTIKDGKVVGGSAVGVANSSLDTTAGELGGAWADWTPTWTNVTVGNGTVTATYTQVGKTVHARCVFTLGSTSSVTGTVLIDFPVTAKSSVAYPIGIAYLDNTGVETYMGMVAYNTTTRMAIYSNNSSTDTRLVTVNASKPVASWGTGDAIKFSICYEAA